MDNKDFLEEIAGYSDDELELIIETQAELYSPAEMEVLKEEYRKRAQIREKALYDAIPEEIVCPKCNGVNHKDADACVFCGYRFDRKKLFSGAYNPSVENLAEEKESYAFQYIISFLIPLVGFILGAILLSKDDAAQRSVGKTCIILGIVSVVLLAVVWGLFIYL